MASLDKTTTESPNVTLTIRLIMQGKEVGSIIGKKGDIVKRFREESGAKINISDGSCPERIVTVTGNTESIFKAFTLICNKFEEDLSNLLSPGTVPRPPITFRLIVPASQCGSLIGKGGSKIKEIREITGASIQVASEMLPNSTERAVTISGNSEAVIQCIYNICCIMSESPPKGVTVPYTPLKPLTVPGVGNGGMGLPALVPSPQGIIPNPAISPNQIYSNNEIMNSEAYEYLGNEMQLTKVGFPMSALAGTGCGNGMLNPAALAVLAAQQPRPATTQQTHEMTVPNELIGCIIGKGGSKVAEIRQLSGAMIRISNCEDRDAPANLDRTITITGNSESVALAQYLINMSMDVFRANLQILEQQQNQAQSHTRPPPTTPPAPFPTSTSLTPTTYYQPITSHHQQQQQQQARPVSMNQTVQEPHQEPNKVLSHPPPPNNPPPNQTQLFKPFPQQTPMMDSYQLSLLMSAQLRNQQVFPMFCASSPSMTSMSHQAANPALTISTKLKAQPSLISLPARDHKFTPY